MRKYYPGITLFKVLASLLVLFSHIKLPELYDELITAFPGFGPAVSIAVPCFYMISGFLAYKGWSNSSNPDSYIKKYLLWIIIIYASFCLFYIISLVIPYFINHGFHTVSMFNQGKRILLDFLIKGPFRSLWFIPPLIAGIAISYYVDRIKRFKLTILLAAASIFIAQLLNGTLRILLEVLAGRDIFVHIKFIKIIEILAAFHLGYGLPFILTGVIISKYEERFRKIRLVNLIFFAAALTITEGIFLSHFVNGVFPYKLVISMMPIGLLLFYTAIHARTDYVPRHHYFLNMFSITVYFSHIFLIKINLKLLNWDSSTLAPGETAICVLLTFIEGVLLTTLITSLIKRRRKKLLID